MFHVIVACTLAYILYHIHCLIPHFKLLRVNIVVGTLKQGYPLLQGEGAAPAEKSLVARITVLYRATSVVLGSPRGQGKGRATGYTHWVRIYCKESTGPPYVTGGPPRWVPDPSEWGLD
jgi:hypothetical protein